MKPDEPGQTYQYLEGGAAIQCLNCNEITHLPAHVRNLFCPKCHAKHSDMMAEKRAAREAEVLRHAD
jgi:Zn finger protein HypA/HybF involved in hydrogenase expression